MSDLRELYQELILDHSKRPRNFGPLEGATHHGHGLNPLCGDDIHLHLKIEGSTIVQAGFHGSGCAICMASASLLTDAVRGLSQANARALFQAVQSLLTSPTATPLLDQYPKLKVFSGVREFPVRVKCASLAWRTLEQVLEGRDGPARTEEVST